MQTTPLLANPNYTPNTHQLTNNTKMIVGNDKDKKKQPSLWQRKIVDPFIKVLKSGTTPEGLALSFACGITGGLFPIPATTTVACIALSAIFKLNFAAVQITNLLMTPVNLATFLYFIQFAEVYLFQNEKQTKLSAQMFKSDPFGAIQQSWIALLKGCVAWLCIFLPIATAILYFTLLPIMKFATKKNKQ